MFEVKQIPYHEARPWIMKIHYAKRDVTATNSFGLYIDKKLKGVCIFGSVIPNVAASFCGDEYKKIVRELSRLVVVDGLERNTLSYFVSKSLKQMRGPWVIISYSDMNKGHHGYIYQALNFYYTGIGGDTREFRIKGEQLSTRPLSLRKQMKLQGIYDSSITIAENIKKLGGEVINLKQGKHRYVYFLGTKKERKKMLSCLRFPILPYPKGDNSKYEITETIKTQLTF